MKTIIEAVPAEQELNIKVHARNNQVPSKPHPRWVSNLGIPDWANQGLFSAQVTVEAATSILKEANELNRPLVYDRIIPLKEAMVRGTWLGNHYDTIRFDWNWNLISGQKRLTGFLEIAEQLHPKYGGKLPVRIEYGLAPDSRSRDDINQMRKMSDTLRFHAEYSVNTAITEMLQVAYKIHSGQPKGSFKGNENAAKRLFSACPDGFIWAASFPSRRNPAFISTAPVRLALVEFYMQHKGQARQFANCLYDDKGDVQQARAMLRWASGTTPQGDVRRKRNVGGGTFQSTIYEKAVAYMQRTLEDKPISSNEWLKPRPWKSTKPHEDFVAALESDREPKVKLFTLAKQVSTPRGTTNQQFNRYLQRHGVINAPVVCAAVRIVKKVPHMTNQEIEKDIFADVASWNHASRLAKNVHKSTGEKLPNSALCAFCYDNRNNDGLKEFFLSRTWEKLAQQIIDASASRSQRERLDVYEIVSNTFRQWVLGEVAEVPGRQTTPSQNGNQPIPNGQDHEINRVSIGLKLHQN